MVTFVVIGHNEVQRLPAALAQVREAARVGDRIVFIDSASTDGSAGVARGLGVEAVRAPRGKGRAVAIAAERLRGERVCFFDADFESSSRNIACALRETLVDTGADMVVGRFDEPARLRVVTPAVYMPLVRALFPEAIDYVGPQPLSGFRAMDLHEPLGAVPPGYGLEAHVNIRFAMEGRQNVSIELGEYRGRLRAYANVPAIAADVARAVLELAQAYHRLDAELRPRWEAWTGPVFGLVRSHAARAMSDESFEARVAELAARPLPATRRTYMRA
jgi:glucosyl-3-phosphoglycerate synthase